MDKFTVKTKTKATSRGRLCDPVAIRKPRGMGGLDVRLLYTLFEYRDGELFWKTNPSPNVRAGDKAGHFLKSGYVAVRINKRARYAHRLIFAMFHGFMPKKIDHIDGNKANNKISNLREATVSQNGFNRKISVNNTSGVKGVFFNKASNKWQVRLYVESKAKYFGEYFDLTVAKFIADIMRKKYHGEFARSE